MPLCQKVRSPQTRRPGVRLVVSSCTGPVQYICACSLANFTIAPLAPHSRGYVEGLAVVNPDHQAYPTVKYLVGTDRTGGEADTRDAVAESGRSRTRRWQPDMFTCYLFQYVKYVSVIITLREAQARARVCVCARSRRALENRFFEWQNGVKAPDDARPWPEEADRSDPEAFVTR